MKSRRNVIIIAAVVLAVFAALVWRASGGVGVRRVTDAEVSEVLADVRADSTATFAIQLREGDPAHEADHVFEPLKAIGGVRKATILSDGPQLVVEFDSSAATEQDIRQAMGSAGYLRE